LGMKFRHEVRGCLATSALGLTKAPEVEFFSESAMAETIGEARSFEEAMVLVNERGPAIAARLGAAWDAAFEASADVETSA
jgi:hypothetical protein